MICLEYNIWGGGLTFRLELTFIITSLPNDDSRSLKDIPETEIKDNTGMDTVRLMSF